MIQDMRKNLSQQKLLEILIAEIEILQQTSKNIKEVAPEIRRQLQELKTAKIKVDLNTDKLEELLEKHKQAVRKNVIIPKWFLMLVGFVLLISVISWFI
jgi:competence CoiA-like predicted nuclease